MRSGGLCLAVVALFFLGACTADPGPWEPVEALTVVVTGQDFHWYYRYPGSDGELGTDDDVRATGPLHVPVGAEVELQLTSTDYIYSLELPDMGLKEMAAPDLKFSIGFSAESEGRFALRGDKFCGFAHETLITELVVEPQATFHAWLADTRRAG